MTGWRSRERLAVPVVETSMIQRNVQSAARGKRGGDRVGGKRGGRIGRVSSERFSQPADERHLSQSELNAAQGD